MSTHVHVYLRRAHDAFEERKHPRAHGQFAHAAAAVDLSGHAKVGHQLGSNPGGVYASATERRYAKFYPTSAQARSEVAAARVYGLLGVPTLNPHLVTHGGKTGVGTLWNSDVKRVLPSELASLTDEKQKAQLADHFMAAVLTKNWDAIGLEYDNVMRSPSGALHSVDLGGAFRHRAMGGPKDFGPDIGESSSMMDPQQPSGRVFRQLGADHLRAAAQRLKSLTLPQVEHAVHGMDDHATVAKNIIARRDKLVAAWS